LGAEVQFFIGGYIFNQAAVYPELNSRIFLTRQDITKIINQLKVDEKQK
jgi:hypothetical protein